MNQPEPQQFQQQPYPQQMPPGQYPPGPYPPPQGGSSGAKIAIIIVCVVVGVLFLGGIFVGVLAVAVTPKLAEAKNKLELKQLGDLRAEFDSIGADSAKRNKLARDRKINDARGEEFWIVALEMGLIDERQAPKLTSLASNTDKPVQGYRKGNVIAAGGHISYTAPHARRLLENMHAKGQRRCVLITWNSRNWRNAGGDQVPVVWSDKDMPVWMTFEEAQRDWGITRAEWDDPAGKLLGKKAPFQNTYE